LGGEDGGGGQRSGEGGQGVGGKKAGKGWVASKRRAKEEEAKTPAPTRYDEQGRGGKEKSSRSDEKHGVTAASKERKVARRGTGRRPPARLVPAADEERERQARGTPERPQCASTRGEAIRGF